MACSAGSPEPDRTALEAPGPHPAGTSLLSLPIQQSHALVTPSPMCWRMPGLFHAEATVRHATLTITSEQSFAKIVPMSSSVHPPTQLEPHQHLPAHARHQDYDPRERMRRIRRASRRPSQDWRSTETDTQRHSFPIHARLFQNTAAQPVVLTPTGLSSVVILYITWTHGRR
ncbi:hypothetical protein VTK56DRAFT_8048 [Thermocarpiscus australiensis]